MGATIKTLMKYLASEFFASDVPTGVLQATEKPAPQAAVEQQFVASIFTTPAAENSGEQSSAEASPAESKAAEPKAADQATEEEIAGEQPIHPGPAPLKAIDESDKFAQLCHWPPDVFAIVSAIVKRSNIYLLLINDQCKLRVNSELAEKVGRKWAYTFSENNPPNEIVEWWKYICDRGDTSLVTLSECAARWASATYLTSPDDLLPHLSLIENLLLLLSASDTAMAGAGHPTPANLPRPIADLLSEAQRLIAPIADVRSTSSRSLCKRIDVTKRLVFPKTQTPQTGINIRSLSHHLSAFQAGEVGVSWLQFASESLSKKRSIRLLLLPWPTRCVNRQFVDTSELARLYDQYHLLQATPESTQTALNAREAHLKVYGYFNYFPDHLSEQRKAQLCEYIDKAKDEHGEIDAVVMPELALTARDYEEISLKMSDRKINLFIAGIGSTFEDFTTIKKELETAITSKSTIGTIRTLQNYAKISVRTTLPSDIVEDLPHHIKEILHGSFPADQPIRHSRLQPKHHRWQLTETQIRQYSLGANLDPKKKWWENIAIPNRRVEFLNFGPGLTTSVLICEDLAQSDPIGEVIRAVGPNLVIALLADGPQTASRWSARYATILSDDPGCSVLSLTNKAMMSLSRGTPSQAPSTSVGLWKDPQTGLTEIAAPPQCEAIVLSLAVQSAKQFTADGRHDHFATQHLTLGGIHYLDPINSRGS